MGFRVEGRLGLGFRACCLSFSSGSGLTHPAHGLKALAQTLNL